jgi:hypothetical protein
MTTVGSAAEIAVLSQVTNAMAELDDAAARRIISWLSDKYRVTASSSSRHATEAGAEATARAQDGLGDLAATVAAAQPRTERERALVAAYWFQRVNGDPDFDGQAINRELKNLGSGVSNITKALSYLIDQRPQLVIQVRKAGTSQQARKKYRLTTAGFETVERMLRGDTSR